jgi:hypothetical protein
MQVFTGPHMHIQIVHMAIQMKMVIITKPRDLRNCWIVSKTSECHHRNQLSYLHQHHNGLAAFEICTYPVSHHLGLSCIMMVLAS